LIAAGEVRLNGRPAKPAARVAVGDAIETPVRDPLILSRQTFDCAVPVLLEEQDFLVVDKPFGLPTHPTARYLQENLVSALRGMYGEPAPTAVHRLDRETSGVLLCARNPRTHRALALQFERREVTKYYHAVVTGVPEQSSGILEGMLGRDNASRVRIRVRVGGTGGVYARTDYRVIRAWEGFSLLELSPKTGRQHQIRAQLQAAGHPVVGDKIYGPDEENFLAHLEGRLVADARAALLLDRHALHAFALHFRHPRTGDEVYAESPLPQDIRTFIATLEEESREWQP
jgi:23S rRNA pseudouridine1911/1915/1917 synthase